MARIYISATHLDLAAERAKVWEWLVTQQTENDNQNCVICSSKIFGNWG